MFSCIFSIQCLLLPHNGKRSIEKVATCICVLTAYRQPWASSNELYELPLLGRVIRAENFKQELDCSTVVGIAVVRPAALH